MIKKNAMIRMRDKNKIGMSEIGDLLISCKVLDKGGPVGTGKVGG